jgi:hypothetical protein
MHDLSGSQVTLELWVLSMLLALCHPFLAYNLKVTPRCLAYQHLATRVFSQTELNRNYVN